MQRKAHIQFLLNRINDTREDLQDRFSTVTKNEDWAVKSSESCTTKVIRAVPTIPFTGVTITNLWLEIPQIAIPLTGIRCSFVECALTRKLEAAVSESETWNAWGTVDSPERVVVPATDVITGSLEGRVCDSSGPLESPRPAEL